MVVSRRCHIVRAQCGRARQRGKVMSVRRVVPNITSDKLDACREFYAGLLGFQVAMDMGWVMTFVSPSNPTAQVSVLREDATAPVVAQITVEVADVDAVHAEALRRGVELVYPLTDEPWGVRRFFVKDPNGVVLNVARHRGAPRLLDGGGSALSARRITPKRSETTSKEDASLGTHTCALIERITLAPTVERDLRKGRSAQRLPAFS
jgi:catechol 2,3-dioxygenase-like lactoylglutathione lyase family enzyme